VPALESTREGVSPATMLALVEALYAFAENPAHWNDIAAAIEAIGIPLDPSRDPEAQAIIGHAGRACAMIDRLNAGRQDRQPGDGPWDAVLLSSEGVVRGRCGRVAERMRPFLLGPLTPGQGLQFHTNAAKVFATAFKGAISAQEAGLVPFTLGSVDEKSACFGVMLPREAFPDGLANALALGSVWTEPLFAVVLLSAKDTQSSGNLAHRSFGLTTAETRLAAKLVQGMRVADAGAELGMTPSTARWHLKNIFAKTGTRRQADLLRLLSDASAFPMQVQKAASMAVPGVPPRRLITLSDGRLLCYREYGPAGGLPVIYFHFGLSASMLPPAAAASVARHGVRVIAFERPGYGQSDPRKDYTFEGIAADVDELRTKLGLRRVALFGDGYGGGFAVATAHRLGRDVLRLALHGANLGWASTNGENRKGLSIFHSQPWFIPTAAEMLRRGLRVPVIRSILSYLEEKSRSDAGRIADPAFSAYLNATIFEALERTSAGLAAELSLFGRNTRSDPSGLSAPIGVWHGDENPVVPYTDSVRDFQNHPTTVLHIVPGMGLYPDATVFDSIFSWLAARPRAALRPSDGNPSVTGEGDPTV
jgi:pimeloyl-ACP methyl ester carboxylesterase/DNA-binding CsgD family transcriptional regulator